MTTETTTRDLRVVTPAMRRLLIVAGVLVALAGIQLFVFSERTERFFAWTIDPPLTAAFLGGSYWASAFFEFSAARQRLWAFARISVPTVFLFTILTFGVTMLHIDRFHLGSDFEVGTRAVTWAWIAIYATVPVVMAVVWWLQARQPGGDPHRERPLPVGLRVLVGTQGVVFAASGIVLLAAPESASWWPWELTALTGRAIGAWLVSFGLAAFHALGENCLVRLRPAVWAYTALGIMQVWALARFPGDFAWGSVGGIVYLVMLASVLLAGIGGLALSRRFSPMPRQP
ncbi:MAG TPA: hypothetical protein VF377_00390 [Acidimicrobiia bacterium]|jgi:hypothetical protein